MVQVTRPNGDCATVNVGSADTDFVTAPWHSKLSDESDASVITASLNVAHPLVGRFCVQLPTIELPSVGAAASEYILTIRMRSTGTTETIDPPSWNIVEGDQATIVQTLVVFSDNPVALTTSLQDFVILGTSLPGDWTTADLTDIALEFSGQLSDFTGVIEIARVEVEFPEEAVIVTGVPEDIAVTCTLRECIITWNPPSTLPDGETDDGYEVDKCAGNSAACDIDDDDDFTPLCSVAFGAATTCTDDDDLCGDPDDPDDPIDSACKDRCYRVRTVFASGVKSIWVKACGATDPLTYGTNAKTLNEPSAGPYTEFKGKPTTYS